MSARNGWLGYESDLSGLEDRRGHASRSSLTPEQEVAVRQRIESESTEVDQVCSLRGKDFQRILAEEFGPNGNSGACDCYATIVRAPVVANGIIVSQVDPVCLHPCRICTIAERQIH